jgi:hypothetical protein
MVAFGDIQIEHTGKAAKEYGNKDAFVCEGYKTTIES